MSADDPHEDTPRAAQRFSVEDARARAQQALKRSEFILSRAYGLLREPTKEWTQIRDEITTIPNILIGYVAPLAAIPPVCGLIGIYVFGQKIGEALERPPIASELISGIVTWIISIALVGLLGLLINAIAPQFDADKNDLAAQKIAAYSLTPAFLSGVFSLWPPLWWVSLFALGAMVFLMYRGLPILMKAPEDRAIGYAATVTVAGMVAAILLFSLASCVS
jgi:hypothetical protein